MPATPSILLSVTPMIPTGASLAEALRFYTEQLGFSITWQEGRMAGIRRGQVSFNLIDNNNREWADNAGFGIEVSDLDALYAELREALAIAPPEVKPWGRREIHLIVPSGVCLQFYEQQSQG